MKLADFLASVEDKHQQSEFLENVAAMQAACEKVENHDGDSFQAALEDLVQKWKVVSDAGVALEDADHEALCSVVETSLEALTAFLACTDTAKVTMETVAAMERPMPTLRQIAEASTAPLPRQTQKIPSQTLVRATLLCFTLLFAGGVGV